MAWTFATNPWRDLSGHDHVVRMVRRAQSEVDRTTRAADVRAGVLGFVYNERAAGRPVPVLLPGAVAASVHWSGDAPTETELAEAVSWLRARDLLAGGHDAAFTARPRITAAGVAAIEDGVDLDELGAS